MKFHPRHRAAAAELDLTPMIDVTFQLIAFFMFVLNFSDAAQDERIHLPISQLAKPPDKAEDQPLTIQLTRTNTVLITGDEVTVPAFKPYLQREVKLMERLKRRPTDITVILRADAAAKTGRVQELIKICQDLGFEKFSLRAKTEVPR